MFAQREKSQGPGKRLILITRKAVATGGESSSSIWLPATVSARLANYSLPYPTGVQSRTQRNHPPECRAGLYSHTCEQRTPLGTDAAHGSCGVPSVVRLAEKRVCVISNLVTYRCKPHGVGGKMHVTEFIS